MSEIQAVHCLVEDAGVMCIIPDDSILPGCFRPRGTDGAKGSLFKSYSCSKGQLLGHQNGRFRGKRHSATLTVPRGKCD